MEPLPDRLPALAQVEHDGIRSVLDAINDYCSTTIPDEAGDQAETPEGWYQLAILKAALEDARGAIAMAESVVVTKLAEAMPEDNMQHGGLGCAIVRGWHRPGKKWDGARLVPVLAARAVDELRIDAETGEIREEPAPPAAIATAVAMKLMECGGLDNASASWRVGKLKEQGLEPNAFYHSDQPAAQYIEMVGRKKWGQT